MNNVKIGDKVRVIKTLKCLTPRGTGWTGILCEHPNSDNYYHIKDKYGLIICITKDELSFLEKVEDPQVGDTVKVLEELDIFEHLGTGWTGVLEPTNGDYNGFDLVTNGKRVYVTKDELKKLEKVENNMTNVKIGDIVKVIEPITFHSSLGTGWTAKLAPSQFGGAGYSLEREGKASIYLYEHELRKLEKVEELQVGDTVKVIKPLKYFQALGTGWTGVLYDRDEDNNWYYLQNDKGLLYRITKAELSQLEKVEPESTFEPVDLNALKVGDKVSISNDCYVKFLRGKIGHITKHLSTNIYTVTLLDGRSYALSSERLDKVNDAEQLRRDGIVHFQAEFIQHGSINVQLNDDTDDLTVIQTSFDTNNGDDDSISIKSYQDGSVLLTIETSEDGHGVSYELDLPLAAVKKLTTTLNSAVELSEVFK